MEKYISISYFKILALSVYFLFWISKLWVLKHVACLLFFCVNRAQLCFCCYSHYMLTFTASAWKLITTKEAHLLYSDLPWVTPVILGATMVSASHSEWITVKCVLGTKLGCFFKRTKYPLTVTTTEDKACSRRWLANGTHLWAQKDLLRVEAIKAKPRTTNVIHQVTF